MKDIDSITIGIPTYMGNHTLARAIESAVQALGQVPELHGEILVGVNGELEQTLTTARACQEKRPELVSVLIEKGASKTSTMNRIAAQANGDALFFLDDDVILERDCLLRCLQSLYWTEGVQLVWANQRIVPLNGGNPLSRFFCRSFSVPYRLPIYCSTEGYVRGRCMGMRRENYPGFPPRLINDDQYLHILYWGKVRQAPGAYFYAYGVSSLLEYHQRFYRISAGRRQMHQYFNSKKIQGYESLVNRPFNWRQIRLLPADEKVHFLTWRLVNWSAKISYALWGQHYWSWKRCSHDHKNGPTADLE
jgi:glycosyltransferase involved in cell wall biosynthesis